MFLNLCGQNQSSKYHLSWISKQNDQLFLLKFSNLRKQVRIQYQFLPESKMKQERKISDTQIAQSILQLNNYHQIASSLQVLQSQSEARFRSVIEELKILLILQPEQIYVHHNNLTIDRLRLIRDIFKVQNNLEQKYFQVHSGYILLAVTQGFLLQNLVPEKMNKLKQIFAKRIQKGVNLWGFDQLENLQAYLIDRTTGYFPNSSPIHHQRQIDRFTYLYSFIEDNFQVFPQMTDIFSIFFKMMLCLREDKQKDRTLLAKLRIKYLNNRYHLQTTIRNMKFVLEFFKHTFSQKECQYYPQKSFQTILAHYNAEQIESLLTITSIGVLWEQAQIYEYFLNCIKLGFSETPRKMMIAMIRFCQKSAKFNELLYNYENNIKRIFIFMKHPKFFTNCLEILKFFIYSPPPTLSLYERFLLQAVIFMGKVAKENKYAFLNLLQTVAFAYKETAPMEELNKIISDNIDTDINRLSDEQLKKILQEYSWKEKINSKTYNLNAVATSKPKSVYKGLTNIGNSCYMNSFLQALFMNKQFLKHIVKSSTLEIRAEKLKDKNLEGKSKEIVEKEIQECVKPFAELQKTFALLLKSIKNEISPLNIRQVAHEMFRNNYQHDSIEFGRLFLDQIFRNNIPAMFLGESTTEIFCKECSQSRQRKEAFLDYHLSAQNGQLQQLILGSFKPEMVQDLTCDHCEKKGKESIKHQFISKFPNYLIISINRFEYDIVEKKNKKNKSKIIINPFLKIENTEYEIYSIIIHTGPSSNAGHYFTFSKTKYQSNCKWICHNDSQVSQFQTFGEVNNFLQNSEQDTPYILFYENREHIEKVKEQLSQPIILREPQEKFVRKENQTFLSSQKKKTFQLQPVNYNYFIKKEDQEDEDHHDRGGFYNNYIA